jgi:uncharacterized protein (DUF488 family)
MDAEMTDREAQKLRVLTIGHSNHARERLLEILQRNGVEVLAEVRSHPYSSALPQFDRETMKESLGRAGAKYVNLGKEPAGRELYEADGPTCCATKLPRREGLPTESGELKSA